MKHFFYLLIFFCYVFIFSIGCEENIKESEHDSLNLEMDSIDNRFFISESKAENIAENFFMGNKKTQTNKSLKITSVPDENGIVVYYVINKSEKGFLVLSADKRIAPILAYSEECNFSFDEQEYPSGLVDWMSKIKDVVVETRMKNVPSDSFIDSMWEEVEGLNTLKLISPADSDPKDCVPYAIIKGPLLSTSWHQRCGFNASTPVMTCAEACNHAKVGCVAVAMGQIMRYHQFPTRYGWSLMPNTTGTNVTASLLRDVGNSVDMDYGCDGSSANVRNRVVPAFKNYFGYSSASIDEYNHQTVKSEINANRPVLLSGGSNSGWWIFSKYTDGHAWVCDGYHNIINRCGCTYLYLHMNWGWVNGSFNGYYGYNNFNPSNSSYNYKVKMVYNIHP